VSTRTRARTGRPSSGKQPRRPEAAPVDPRVRDRWVAVRRDQGRRRLRLLLAFAVVVALLAAAWGISVSPLLDIDHVEVRGLDRLTAAQIEDAGGVHPGDAMAWLDPGRAVTRIEALPFVRRATVSREWPDTVRIAIVERQPVAWIDRPAGKVVVDRSGRVLESVDDAPPGTPQLIGSRVVPPPGATISPVAGARVAAGLTGFAAAGTRSVTVTDAGVSIQLQSGPEIRMGDATQVDVKIRAALAVLAASTGNAFAYIDVSVPTNPVAG
jgi:cell division protein FtsQ